MSRSAHGMDFALATPRPRQGRAGWLREELRQAILSGRLLPGARLPATRELARQHGLARGTVVTVYEQLQSEGYLDSRRGGGTWVEGRLPLPRAVPPKISPVATSLPGPMAGLQFPYPARPFRMHEPAVDQFPMRVWARLAGRRLRTATRAEMLGRDRRGYLPLRRALAGFLAHARGVQCTPDQIFVTTGVQQGLDWIARLLVRPGESAGLEDPGYFGARMAWQNAGAKLAGFEVDAHGLFPTQRKVRPRVIYTTPAHQFPLGMTMPLARRLEVLAWAREEGCYVVEDDYDSEYRFDGAPVPALLSLDGDGRVILVGSFNKQLFPALRLGYLVVPEGLIEPLAELRFGMDLNSFTLDQGVMADFIEQGELARHLRRMRELYGSRLEALRRISKRYWAGLLELPPAAAGLFTPAFLRNGMDSRRAESAAAGAGVETMGLHRFVLRVPDPRGLLLGFGAFEESAMRTAAGALARALGG